MIPEAFAAGTTAREGETGAAWLDDLPTIVQDLLDRWSCTPDGDWMHGEVGVIVPVRRTGEPLVMKVSFPHPGNVHEPDAYTAWNGRGAVHLHERADADYAMLLERAHPTTLRDSGADVAVVGGEMSRLLAIPAPKALPHPHHPTSTHAAHNTPPLRDQPHNASPLRDQAPDATPVPDQAPDATPVPGQIHNATPVLQAPGGPPLRDHARELPRLSDRADEWAEELARDAVEFAGALPDAVVARASAVIDELVREQPDVLVHGDLHHRNILSADREPWLAVDPKGLIGDPAYDAVTFLKARTLVLMHGDLLQGMERELAAYCEAAELDRQRVRRWIQLELVRTAYWVRRYGVGAVRRGDIARDPAVQMIDELAINWA
ncbi:aminoglycoside phosphotransferase family protein [Kribbella sp. NPDC056951]|uniref:aminoglycoside phosphotransferase family protein n=1 Tax=Kribbella sp. NPDC056951 TaxID=3345978 RepID=UPI0036315B01